MSRYAPKLMELAPRDMVSRAIYLEVRDGRGAGPKGDYVLPRRAPPRAQGDRGEAARHHRLRPGLPRRRAAHGAGPDPADGPLRDGRRSRRTSGPGSSATSRTRSSTGLFAAGEVACVSVHGANRLGTNSLVDLLVFGRRAGRDMAAYCRGDRACPRSRPTPTDAGPRRARGAPGPPRGREPGRPQGRAGRPR